MRPETRGWLEGLRGFAAEHRRTKPLRTFADAAEHAAERAILAAHLVSWLDDLSTEMASRRAGGGDRDPDPVIVLTTTAAGIEAAETLAAGGHPLAVAIEPRLAAVTELEYRLWCIRFPDDTYRLHVNHWNWIKTRVPPQREGEFTRHPLAPGDRYWLHRTGTAGVAAADRRDCHLWKWNGRHASLLEARVREATISHLDGSEASDSLHD